MRFLYAVILILLSANGSASADTLRLAAEAGQFNAKTLAPHKDSVSFRATAKLLALNPSPKWPAASYIGVHQGKDRNDSVQVLAIRNKATDNYLVIGYRLLVGGKEVKVESLADVPLDAVMRVQIQYKNGVTHIQVNDLKPVEVHTPFKQVAPYVSVSSGEAEFATDLLRTSDGMLSL